MSGRLEGRRVLVVGGGQQDYGQEDPPAGIGRAIALLAAREGAAVAVADVDRDAAEATARLVDDQRAGGEEGATVALELDIADERSTVAGIAAAADQLGGLGGLVFNAGIVGGWGLEHTSGDDWDRVFAVNVRGPFLGCREALGLMPRGGAITLTSSIAASLPSATEIPAYGTSKAALDGLCRYAGKEAAGRGVRVNVVMAGLIDTPLGRLASQAKPDREATAIPLGAQGTAHDVAGATAFLLSDDAAYVTGQTLVVDGGLSGLG